MAFSAAFFQPRAVPQQWSVPSSIRRHMMDSLFPSFRSRAHISKISLSAGEVEMEDSNAPSSTLSYMSCPSVFFLGLATSLLLLMVRIQQVSLPIPPSIGTVSLFCVTAAVCYDNLVIALGALFAPNILKWLSYPRFLLHFVGVPFLYTTIAEIVKAAGWLSNSTTTFPTSIPVLSTAFGIISTIRFFLSPGIKLADTSDFPTNGLAGPACRKLVWFTYAEKDFLCYVFPSILVALWSLLAGLRILDTSAGIWLIVSAMSVLVGSAQNNQVARFTGNFAEVVMLWCMFMSAASVR